MEKIMYVINYIGGESGCPETSIYGELVGYNWNSNDFSDKKFPDNEAVLDFYAQHKTIDTDFFYFGSEFICSEPFLELIKSHKCGSIDIREVRIHQESKSSPVAEKKYYLVRSREVHKILDMKKSEYELRIDPTARAPEEDAYHSGRVIFDVISKFCVTENICGLDFFVSSEMLKEEYVFSDELGRKIIEHAFKGVKLTSLSEFIYDAKLEF
jgi:hypothetical protein